MNLNKKKIRYVGIATARHTHIYIHEPDEIEYKKKYCTPNKSINQNLSKPCTVRHIFIFLCESS